MHNHHHLFHFLHNRELDELYACMALKAFSLSMVGVFVPIFLVKLGYAVSDVLLFYALVSVAHGICTIPSAKLARKFGVKHTMLGSIPLLIISLAALYTLETVRLPLAVPSLLLGMYGALFWTGYHAHFSRSSQHESRGKEVGFSKLLVYLFAFGGPVAGGILLSLTSFKVLFIAVSFMLFGAIAPLFFSGDHLEAGNVRARHVFAGRSVRDFLAYVGFGIETGAGAVVWPLFIYHAITESYTVIGSVASISLFCSMALVFLVGMFADMRRHFVLRVGAFLHAVLWTAKTFITNSFQVFIADSFHGMTKSMKDAPFEALCYDKANASNIIEYIMFREMSIHTGRIFFFTTMILVGDLFFGFMFGSVGSLLYLLF